MTQISLAEQFSPFPAGRYKKNAKYSGEEFREDYLVPALRTGNDVTVILDGTRGFNPSFLEEAFGGLVREHNYTEEDLSHRLALICSDNSIILQIRGYISKAQQKKAGSEIIHN